MANGKLKDAGLKTSPSPIVTNTDEQNGSEGGLIKLLEGAFFAPMLSLVQIYLYRSNGNRKTLENCTQDFRYKHSGVWKILFVVDLGFRIIYLAVVLLVVARGLAIDEYIKLLLNSV